MQLLKTGIFILASTLLFFSGFVNAQDAQSNAHFIENKGQWPEQIRFMTQVPGGYMWFGNHAFRASIVNPDFGHTKHKSQKKTKDLHHFSHAYELEFEGGNAKEITSKGTPANSIFNFYLGQNRSNWASGAKAFDEILYRDMYPGVDIRLYHQASHLKYDLQMKEAKSIEQVRIKYNGLDGIRLKDGNLILKTSVGNIEESIPVAYQVVNGKRLVIPCMYQLKNNGVQFIFPKGYLADYPLVIDPQVVFYTYSGSFSDNWGNTAVGDKFGNSYLAGTVYGPTFPKTLGAFDITYNGSTPHESSYDIGIQKFSPDGTTLLYSTFLGGNQADSPHSINLDKDNNLLLLGSTSSTNFPLSQNPIQGTFGGGESVNTIGFSSYRYNNGSDIFISKLNPEGTNLLASTYLGGSANDGLMTLEEELNMNYGDAFRGDITSAADGSIFISSCTASANFPIKNPNQNTNRGLMDGIVARLSPGLDSLIWSTYLGGSGMDAVYSIQLQGTDKVVVCGGSKSSDFPVSADAFQIQITGTSNERNSFCDAIVASYTMASGVLLRSTFSGTTSYDQAYLVQSDPDGNVLIMGQTMGTMPKTVGTYGQSGGGVFLQKFNPELKTLLWSTTFGSDPSSMLVPSAFLVDTCGRIYFSGWGGDSNQEGTGYSNGDTYGFPVTPDALKGASDGSDFYICVLGVNAQSLEYGTYFGGSSRPEHVDGGMSRFDKSGIITQAVCGCKDGTSFYHGTTGSYSPSIKSNNCNQGVVKIDLGVLKADFAIITNQISCGGTVNFTNQSSNGRQYTWYFGDGDSLASNSSSIQHTYDSSGTFIIRLKAVNTSTCKKIAFYMDTITILNPFSFVPDTVEKYYCKGDRFTPELPNQAGVSKTWITTKDIVNNNFTNPILQPTSPTFYTIQYKSSTGCIQNSYYKTLLKSDLKLEILDSLVISPCDNKAALYLIAKPSESDFYRWKINTDTREGKSVVVPDIQQGIYNLKLNGQKKTCPDSALKTITIAPFDYSLHSDFTHETRTESCSDRFVHFKNNSAHVENYNWNFGDGSTSIEKEPGHQFREKGSYEVTLLVSNQKCSSKSSLPVDFEPIFIPNLITLNGDGKNEAFVISGLGTGVGLDVYNRWGKRVFNSAGYRNDWMPTNLDTGVYFFQLHFPNGKGCNSWIEVIR